MAKVAVPTTYNVAIDEALTFVAPDGKETQGSFVMTSVGGELDGTVMAVGPAPMGLVLQGMLKLASWGAREVQSRPDGQALLKSIITDEPIERTRLLGSDGAPL